jgi:hypothetical protein
LGFTLIYTETETVGGLIFTDAASLTLPGQTGTDIENQNATNTFSVTGGKCHGKTVPAANEGDSTSVPTPGGPGTR